MKLLHLIAPALALAGSASWLYHQDDTIRELTEMSVMVMSSENPEAAVVILSESRESLGLEGRNRRILSSQFAAKDPAGAAAQQNFASALALVDTLDLEDPGQVFASLALGVKAGDQDAKASTLTGSGKTRRNGSPGSQRKKSMTKSAPTPTVKSSKAGPRDNFAAAGEWVQSQEAGPTKNAAVETYASTLAPHEPAAAVDWAETLPPRRRPHQPFQRNSHNAQRKGPHRGGDLFRRIPASHRITHGMALSGVPLSAFLHQNKPTPTPASTHTTHHGKPAFFRKTTSP
ncbi:MAG: hypothetical protein ACJAVK_000006 [Akkermansiaceae bacterium]|jgi:hypothetical protein